MFLHRVTLVFASIALVAVLSACQCQIGQQQGSGNKEENFLPAGKDDPAEASLKGLNGKVKRDASLPGKPVVEVHLFSQTVTDDDFKELTQFDQLRKLEVSKGTFAGTGLAALAKLPLQELHLTFCSVTDDGLKTIATFKSLKVLDLMNDDKITDEGLPALAALSNMEELTVGQNFKVKDVGLSKALGGMKRLRKLDVSNSSAGDGAMAALLGCPEMQVLVVHGSKVTDAGMASVGKLAHLREIRADAQLTDNGLAAIAGLTELKSLDAFNTHVTFAGLKSSPLLPHLKDLTIGGPLCRITDSEVNQLRQAAPSCNITKR
ncbi:MAG TPA: hypothetical protein VGI99_08385 [Gemmataceae bacterium]|jgi:hypothetical protein